MAKRNCWSHRVGTKPHIVTVYQRTPNGVLYARAWDPAMREGRGGMRRMSLGHRDRAAAKAYAARQHAQLVAGDADLLAGRITIARVFALYQEHRTPKKAVHEQKADARRMRLFSRAVGADRDPLRITLADWERLIQDRRSGAISACGQSVHITRRRPVRDRTIEADLKWLNAVFNWARKWQDRDGRYLLRENPIRGFKVPREKNPRRPVMTQGRYEALLEVAGRVMMEIMAGGRTRVARSYLPELLVLANETGRRLSAILGLTYEDLRLEGSPNAPYGAISWPADTDKQGRAWKDVPLTAACRRAIDCILRDRPGIGAAPIFPAPENPTKPVDRHLADRWLREAETHAGLTPQEGGLWHPFRRKAATELKSAPDKDVMALLGWTDLRSLKTAYQHADQATMLMALQNRAELREAR